MADKITVTVRKAGIQGGYLLSVSRKYGHAAGGQTFPGPRCSSKATADEVARWIENHLR